MGSQGGRVYLEAVGIFNDSLAVETEEYGELGARLEAVLFGEVADNYALFPETASSFARQVIQFVRQPPQVDMEGPALAEVSFSHSFCGCGGYGVVGLQLTGASGELNETLDSLIVDMKSSNSWLV